MVFIQVLSIRYRCINVYQTSGTGEVGHYLTKYTIRKLIVNIYIKLFIVL